MGYSLSSSKFVEQRRRVVFGATTTDIMYEHKQAQKALDRKENPPKPGIRGGIKKLLDLGFPDEELIKRIQKEYGLKNEDRFVVLNILNDLKKEKRNEENLKENENER